MIVTSGPAVTILNTVFTNINPTCFSVYSTNVNNPMGPIAQFLIMKPYTSLVNGVSVLTTQTVNLNNVQVTNFYGQDNGVSSGRVFKFTRVAYSTLASEQEPTAA